ncbi:MgtC/SapB family protein [Heyndrickxia oleronia]|uniref:MgtC/SapB transporter n=1 Tax=Heyndrickxia oleronia TaxID=38875 RepID=A0A8E2ICC8_9BACI|nr:MgtC/SapB family protein [Heyndrickxia oleronia]NYV65188.1 MgtC/SapB family protein [Bacillus sp. Gen3]OJH20235.1 MgtC/SapB transporter [Bacillus obstructivus]MBU5213054.1 MgtC/SapB family protein [Heyndrickxia oleronia]MEC1377133.1 MgtC/SapB family protein [Heyndrickxia oleronia]OOP69933.1 MgtC/SapB transporter [Heyndrickxia oleronia]
MMELFADVDIDTIIKLSISAILGLTIGLERELKRKPLGLKTSLVISIVSCLLTIVSIQSAYLFPGSKYINIQMDPLRLAAQIVSGIGFLGAGVIMRKGDDTISGLTTAALVWGAAGIGIATGAGFYFEAIAGVILLIISVELIPGLIRILGVKRLRSKELRVRLTLKKQEDIASVLKNIQEKNIKIEHIRIKDLQDQSYLVDLKVMVSYKQTTPDIYYGLAKIDKIYSTEISG